MSESISAYIDMEKSNMKSESNHAFRLNVMTLTTGVFAMMILASGSAALAGDDDDDDGNKMTVSGNSTFSDCGLPASDIALEMTGDLEGCLTIHPRSSRCEKLNGFDKYTEPGERALCRYHKRRGIRHVQNEVHSRRGLCRGLLRSARK